MPAALVAILHYLVLTACHVSICRFRDLHQGDDGLTSRWLQFKIGSVDLQCVHTAWFPDVCDNARGGLGCVWAAWRRVAAPAFLVEILLDGLGIFLA